MVVALSCHYSLKGVHNWCNFMAMECAYKRSWPPSRMGTRETLTTQHRIAVIRKKATWHTLCVAGAGKLPRARDQQCITVKHSAAHTQTQNNIQQQFSIEYKRVRFVRTPCEGVLH